MTDSLIVPALWRLTRIYQLKWWRVSQVYLKLRFKSHPVSLKVFFRFFSFFRNDEQPQMCVLQFMDAPVLVFLSGQMLVSVVKAPLQFYYLNTGTGNQRAN